MAEESSVEAKSVGPSSPRSPHSAGGANKAASPRSPNQQPRRIRLGEQQLLSGLSREELAARWREQEAYLDAQEARAVAAEGNLTSLKESVDKYRQQYSEASHREKILVRRLASKEQEIQEYVAQLTEMKASNVPSASALRSALLDPAVNILIQKLRQELISTKAKLEDTQNELSAWKFTPDSNTGKRLMAKCRLLYQENEELGRMISSGRIAKLEGELALQKSYSEEVKKSQCELDEFLQDLDEDVEGMQSTIYFLQQELRKARESVILLQQENATLKSSVGENQLTNGLSPHTPPIKLEQPDDSANSSSTAAAAAAAAAVKLEDGGDGGAFKGARTPPASDDNITCAEAVEAATEEEEEEEAAGTGKAAEKEQLNDESSCDSAALILKADNSELLSEREDEEEDGRNNGGRQQQQRAVRTNNKQAGSADSVSVGSNRAMNATTTTTTTTATNGEEVQKTRSGARDRTKREKSGGQEDSDEERMRQRRKKRRGSLLSLEYDGEGEELEELEEEEALVLTNGEAQSDPE